jgi:hypothetical protein
VFHDLDAKRVPMATAELHIVIKSDIDVCADAYLVLLDAVCVGNVRVDVGVAAVGCRM